MHLTLIPPTLMNKMMAPLSPIPHIHWEIANLSPTPPTPQKTRKIKKIKLMIKLQYIPPVKPTHPDMIPPMIPPKIMAPQTPIYNIQWEIANSPPTPPKAWKTRKRRKTKLMIKLQSTTPLLPTHPSLILPMLPPNILAPLTPITHSNWEIANLPPTLPPPQKTRKRRKKLMIKTHLTPPPLPLMHPLLIPPMLPPKTLTPHNPISHIHWEIAINIAKSSPTPKK